MALSIPLGLKPQFGYVAASVVASWAVHHIYMAGKVIKARKAHNVKYPDLYATKENCADATAMKKFNCVQRAHQNSLENQPIFLALLLSSGLQYPVTAAALGAVYLAGRVMYMEGYSTGDPEKRQRGGFAYIGLLGLAVTAIKFSVDLLRNV